AMNGANLIQANLEMADLSGAQLLKSPTKFDSAKLDGAFLKNANLAEADLTGASLTNANWYSTSPKTCPGSTWTGTCASGEETILSNVNLEGAYLNGLDLTKAILQAAKMDGALLVGVNFTRAKLGLDPDTGASTSLIGAFLQGADFTDADVTGADFFSAYVDLTSTEGGSIAFQLPPANLGFTGFWNTEPECVLFDYPSQTTVPPNTDSINTCPDKNGGPCTDEQWQAANPHIDQAQPPSSSNFPTQPAGACTTFADLDFNW
ncbi:MAG: pentapeptide repeat-containing protein, partial [bacterium]|nr:pentapeptide repeat-containing protein [bacterium]